jgi:integrase
MALTDVRIRQAKAGAKPYKMGDGHGLYVQVMPNGSKYWRYKYRLGHREHVFAVGTYPALSIAEARNIHAAARRSVKAGDHPIKEKRRQKVAALQAADTSFEKVARAWHSANVDAEQWTWRHAQQIIKSLEADAFPQIGRTPIHELTAGDVLEMLRLVEKRGAPAVAINLRQWVSAVFIHAIRVGLCANNPALALKGVILRPPIEHAQALGRAGAGTLLARIRGYGGNLTTKAGMALMAYTFVRTTEMRNAEWDEFDLDSGIWLIPAPKMKMRREHLVPLSRQAVDVVRSLIPLTGAGRFLFPNSRRADDVMSATTVNRALEHMGYASGSVSGHDFRATASTMLYEAGYREELVEMQLAHAERNKTKRAYNHAKYVDERRVMMQWFADELDASATENAALAIARGQ